MPKEAAAVADNYSERTSVPPPAVFAAEPRDVDTVPYVELADGRLQGVVSSGSDVERVYCAFIEAGSLAYYSSTNNDRPDAHRFYAELEFSTTHVGMKLKLK